MLNCCEELYHQNFYVSLCLEGIATALLVFIGGATFIKVDFALINYVPNDHVMETAVVFGIVLAGLSYCLKNVSGAHINPAISMAALLTRRVSILRGFLYIFFQSAGGNIVKVNYY